MKMKVFLGWRHLSLCFSFSNVCPGQVVPSPKKRKKKKEKKRMFVPYRYGAFGCSLS